MEAGLFSDLWRQFFGIRADLKHQLWWVWSALASVGIRCDRTWHLHVYTVTCYPSSLPRLSSVWLRTQNPVRPERLWVCDVKCGQGVPGLALTTEQGSVFVLGSHLALVVYWHIVCSRASLSHRKAVNMGRTCGKANSTKLFFWILVETSCIESRFFFI